MSALSRDWLRALRRTGKLLCVLLPLSATPACAQTQPSSDGELADAHQERNPDPWESFNRPMYEFNDFLDRWFLRPVAKGYQWITPDPVESGVSNFFGNLREPFNLANNLLQGKWSRGASDGGRFLVNTTIGVVGLFDVASHWGLQRSDEDLGQTLGYWGVGSGPYLVLPLLGPRTVRDAAGSGAEGFGDLVMLINDVPVRNSLIALRIVDLRASLLAADEMMTGDRYTFMRDAYLQRREFLVNDGVVEDDFGSDDFEAWEPEE